MLPAGERCAHVAGEIVLYIINTVIKLVPERATVHFTKKREGGNRQGIGAQKRDTGGREGRYKKKGIEIRVSRHVFIRREAVTGFYVFIYLSSRAVYTTSGYISAKKYI